MRRPNKCSCRCARPVLIDWIRHMHVVGPLHDDTTIPGYNIDWIYNFKRPVLLRPSYIEQAWCAAPDFGVLPDDRPTVSSSHWNRKMKPIRYTLSTADRVSPSAGGTLFNGMIDGVRIISENAHPAFGTAVLDPPFFYPPPVKNTIPLDGHFNGSTVSSLSFSLPIGSQNPSFLRAKFFRVLIDSMDMTGVVPINIRVNKDAGVWQYIAEGMATANFTATNVTNKEILIDIWAEIDITKQDSTVYGDGTSLNVGRELVGWAANGTHGGAFSGIVAQYHHFVHGISGLDVNAKQATTKPYHFEFSDPITNGETELTTQSGDPWTVTRTNRSVKLQHTNTDSVELFYGQEIVEILLSLTQKHGADFERIWQYRYFVTDTGHYGGSSPGVFDPNISQVFILRGFSVNGTDFFSNPASLAALAPFCPETITVGPIT